MTKSEKKDTTANILLVLLITILLGGMALTVMIGNSGSKHSYVSAGSSQSTSNQGIK